MFIVHFKQLVTHRVQTNQNFVLKCIPSVLIRVLFTAQKMKFYIKDFFSECHRIHSFLRIWPHLLRKSLMENLIFCAVVEDHEKVSTKDIWH